MDKSGSAEKLASRIANTRRSLPIALLRAREAVMSRFRPMLAGCGVTEQQWRVLRVLAERGQVEAGVVAEHACILSPSLSRIIRTLEQAGYLKSSSHKSDGRRTLLQLTPRGQALLDGASAERTDIYAEVEKQFGKKNLKELLDLLELLQERLDLGE